MDDFKPVEQSLSADPQGSVSVTCTGCPMGCLVTVTRGPEGDLVFQGAQCVRGETYARQEITNPVRPLTTLIAVPQSRTPLSVKTSQPVPKARLLEILQAIHQLKIELPIHIGDILAEDLLGTGIAVIATRSLK